jgi:hypothetical protein
VKRCLPAFVLALLLAPLLALTACSSGPVPPDWQLNATTALNYFQQSYLRGETRVATLEFDRAKEDLASTGRPSLIARAELVRCAVRAASLEFDGCPEFEKRRVDAGPEELAYADYLAGRGQHAAAADPVSRIVFLGLQFQAGTATPDDIVAAIDLASAQGWRRPLLAWLGVQEKRAEAAGDREALERIRRRIALASGKA